MLRRIRTVVVKDLRTGTRDPIASYMLLSALLVAVVLRLVVPILSGSAYHFALGPEVPTDIVAAFDEQGTVTVHDSRRAVVERVEDVDDVVGVVLTDGRAEVLLEGDEPTASRLVPSAILEAHATGADLPSATNTHLGYDLAALLGALAAFSALVLAGLFVGFTILEEKEEKVLALVATSPLRFGEYVLAKLVTPAVVGLVLAVLSVAIVTDGHLPPSLAVALLVAMPSALLLGFIVGALADNQLAAIALLKILMLVFTSLPVAGFAAVGTAWEPALWPFANHWAVQLLYAALADGTTPGRELTWALVTVVPPVLAVGWLLRTRLGFGAQPRARALASMPQAALRFLPPE